MEVDGMNVTRVLSLLVLIMVMLLISCPKEIEEDLLSEFHIDLLPTVILHETFTSFLPDNFPAWDDLPPTPPWPYLPFSREWDINPLTPPFLPWENSQWGAAWAATVPATYYRTFEWPAMHEGTPRGTYKFSLNHRAGRIAVVNESGRNVLRMWMAPGSNTLRSFFFFLPRTDITPGLWDNKLLVQYRVRLRNTNVVHSNFLLYHTRDSDVMSSLGNSSVQLYLNGNGTFNVYNNEMVWEEWPIPQDVWHTVEILMDYASNRYQLYLNGEMLIDNLQFQIPPVSPATGFGKLGWYCNNQNMVMYISDIRVSTDADFTF